MGRSTPQMLKRLRAKFVAITMALVGVVLGVSFISSFVTSYRTQISQTRESLTRVLEDTSAPRWGRLMWRETFPDDMEEKEIGPDDEGDSTTQLLSDAAVIKIFTSNTGEINDGNDAYQDMVVTIDYQAIADKILMQSETEGVFKELHITWMRNDLNGFGHVIVLVDTTNRDEALKSQAITLAVIYVAAMLALFAASWLLSSLALKPVEDAWGRQRRFIADASHELKTPLAVILANTQILQKDEGIPEDSMRWVDSTSDEASRMNELVTELLELARADEATQAGSSNVMAMSDINLSEMVDTATLEFDAVAFERGCVLRSEIEPNIHVNADRSWMSRAVRILIDNATKYAEEGSTVDVKLKRDGKRVVYTVHNQGNPIDKEDLDHIFDRFYRSDRARSRSDAGGFGLGLAIAKSIVEAHGGTISATSSEAKGTTFTIVL